MTTTATTANVRAPKKLYLLQLSATTVPLGEGRTMEMILPCYLIETINGRHILIDTGIAPETRSPQSPPARDEKSVLEHLAQLNLLPQDIDTVICTHFDVDHCGYHDAFPHAEFVVQREHHEDAKAGNPRFAPARAHWDHPALRYRLIDGDTEFLPGIDLLATSGHVLGHQSVLVCLPEFGPILLAIDAVMMQRLFTMDRKPWPKDDNGEQLLASTRKLLDIVERENVQLTVFGHDGDQWKSLKKSPQFYE
jgi:N-acyl homoserine lactone hydrolase